MSKPLVIIKPDAAIEHNCYNGTKFFCSRADLRAPIRVENIPANLERQMADVSEFIGWHAVVCLPCFQGCGFRGYGAIAYEVVLPN